MMNKELEKFGIWCRETKNIINIPIKELQSLWTEFSNSAQFENSNVSDNVDEKKKCNASMKDVIAYKIECLDGCDKCQFYY